MMQKYKQLNYIRALVQKLDTDVITMRGDVVLEKIDSVVAIKQIYFQNDAHVKYINDSTFDKSEYKHLFVLYGWVYDDDKASGYKDMFERLFQDLNAYFEASNHKRVYRIYANNRLVGVGITPE